MNATENNNATDYGYMNGWENGAPAEVKACWAAGHMRHYKITRDGCGQQEYCPICNHFYKVISD